MNGGGGTGGEGAQEGHEKGEEGTGGEGAQEGHEKGEEGTGGMGAQGEGTEGGRKETKGKMIGGTTGGHEGKGFRRAKDGDTQENRRGAYML